MIFLLLLFSHQVVSKSFAAPWTVACQAPLSMGFPGKSTEVGCRFLLQGIFPRLGSNLYLLHCRRILYYWATREACEIFVRAAQVDKNGTFWTSQNFSGHSCAVGTNKCLRADETVPTEELWGQCHASACVERALLIKPISVFWTQAPFKFEESWAWVANLPPLPAPPCPTGPLPLLPVASPSHYSCWKLPDQGLLWLTQPCGGPVGNCHGYLQCWEAA